MNLHLQYFDKQQFVLSQFAKTGMTTSICILNQKLLVIKFWNLYSYKYVQLSKLEIPLRALYYESLVIYINTDTTGNLYVNGNM